MAGPAAEEKVEAPIASAAPASGGPSKLVMILSLVNTLAVVGMMAILFISFQREKNHPSVEDIATRGAGAETEAKGEKAEGEGKAGEGKDGAKKKAADFGKIVALEKFTVNLSTPGSVNPKYVSVNISLEVPTEDLENEVNAKLPQVRNVIIDLFNSKRPTDLANADGRDYLKEEIKNAINGFLVHGKISGVYFTNFAMTS